MDLEQLPEIDLNSFEHASVHKIDGHYWFYEKCDETFPGQSFGLRIEKVHMHTKLAYQDILVFASTDFGNVLVLNGIIQCTERDEFAYQETISHTALMAHANPRKVLIIGGGDCGVLREVARHLNIGHVEHITMVEIDEKVVELLRKFFPEMAPARLFSDLRIDLQIMDGFAFLAQSSQTFDVIITDSLDPEGPAVEFFEESYFRSLCKRLAPGGIVIMQSSENIWLNIDYLKGLMAKARTVFQNVQFCQCYMPSYTSGQLGLIIATNDPAAALDSPARTMDAQIMSDLRYYNHHVHRASFVLPNWAARSISQ